MNPRKRTRFKVCAAHAGWFAGIGRARMAEVFGEGGPASASSCGPTSCRVAPGTDLFVASICDRWYDCAVPGHVFSWDVNPDPYDA
jgi:hypothetical protein